MRVKNQVFACALNKYSLLETMLFENGHITFLDMHLDRLERSCRCFGISLAIRLLLQELEKKIRGLSLREKSVIRVLVDQQGNRRITSFPVQLQMKRVKVMISSHRIDSNNLFLRHKTTNRRVYTAERAKALKKGFFDAVFINEKNELTEGCITNLFVLLKGILYTPPVSSGLLPGVLREYLLRKKKVAEKVLCPADLLCPAELFVGNSIHGLIPVVVECPAIIAAGR